VLKNLKKEPTNLKHMDLDMVYTTMIQSKTNLCDGMNIDIENIHESYKKHRFYPDIYAYITDYNNFSIDANNNYSTQESTDENRTIKEDNSSIDETEQEEPIDCDGNINTSFGCMDCFDHHRGKPCKAKIFGNISKVPGSCEAEYSCVADLEKLWKVDAGLFTIKDTDNFNTIASKSTPIKDLQRALIEKTKSNWPRSTNVNHIPATDDVLDSIYGGFGQWIKKNTYTNKITWSWETVADDLYIFVQHTDTDYSNSMNLSKLFQGSLSDIKFYNENNETLLMDRTFPNTSVQDFAHFGMNLIHNKYDSQYDLNFGRNLFLLHYKN